MFLTFRSVHLQVKLREEFLINDPGSNSDSTKIWKPLQIPKTGTPSLPSLLTSFIIGLCAAMIPARNLSPKENPPGMIIAL